MRGIFLTLCIFSVASCQKMCRDARSEMSPEQVVEAYLETSLNMSSTEQKEVLLDLTTGELNSALNAANDETITEAFVKRNYDLQNYSVTERRDRTPRETEITFELIYKDLGQDRENKPEDAPVVNTENTVSVVKESGIWRIRDVIGKQTTIDFPIAPDVITATYPPDAEGEEEAESELDPVEEGVSGEDEEGEAAP